jgi:hypothetical protein
LRLHYWIPTLYKLNTRITKLYDYNPWKFNLVQREAKSKRLTAVRYVAFIVSAISFWIVVYHYDQLKGPHISIIKIKDLCWRLRREGWCKITRPLSPMSICSEWIKMAQSKSWQFRWCPSRMALSKTWRAIEDHLENSINSFGRVHLKSQALQKFEWIWI